MCFGCSKEPPHRDGSFEYPQHMFWLRNEKNNFQLHTLIWGPAFLFPFSNEMLVIRVGTRIVFPRKNRCLPPFDVKSMRH